MGLVDLVNVAFSQVLKVFFFQQGEPLVSNQSTVNTDFPSVQVDKYHRGDKGGTETGLWWSMHIAEV